MDCKIVSFRRGRHTYTPRQFIVMFEGVDNKAKAEKYVGRELMWKTESGKEIKGKVTAVHGSKGMLRALFEKGLPGQAITTHAKVL